MAQDKVDIRFIFEITDKVLWNTFKKNEIGDVLLPFVVLRRLDCILKDRNEAVWKAYENFKDKVADDKIEPILRKAAGGLQFYNTSRHTLEKLCESPKTIEIDFNNYLNGFNSIVLEILDNFQFDKVVARLIRNKLLYEMILAICNVDLRLEVYDNHKMGYIFEELIRISNEQSNETAGEHFTPRDVIRLMNTIVFSTEKEILSQPGIIRTIYDPTLGTGGMVNLAKNYILDKLVPEARPTIKTFGQEINEQAYAIARSEALITGGDVENIRHGNTLTDDRFLGQKFHYQFANPPYGVTWAKDADYVVNESANPLGRFSAGLPAKSDGQLLFIQHMVSKMENNGKIAVVTNGSPLFSGGAGSGESNIRKWLIENDFLDCIIGLPKDLFYNTGISTYIWFLSNNKPRERRGKVQLINASVIEDRASNRTGFAMPLKHSLGNKRNEILQHHIDVILQEYKNFGNSKYSKVFDNKFFGYYQITVIWPEVGEKNKKSKRKRDKENVPLLEDIREYFEREVLPNVPGAEIDVDKTRIGYEINFAKCFYEYKSLPDSSEIEAEIKVLEFGDGNEKGVADLLKELFAW